MLSIKLRCFIEFSADSPNIKKVFKKLLGTLLCLPLKKRNYFITRISNIIEKTFLCRSCFSCLSMFAIYE